MVKAEWTKLAPPGTNTEKERGVFLMLEVIAVVYAVFCFANSYGTARGMLFDYVGEKQILIQGAVIAPFREIIHGNLLLFLPAAAVMLALVLVHYLSYRRGSMSIYLMKRLPDRSLLHRQCWSLPLLGCLLLALTAAILVGLFYLIYWYATPAVCLPEVMGR